jgi:hypothetical protein
VPDYGSELQFGAFIPPVAAQAGDVLELARLADVVDPAWGAADARRRIRDLLEQVGRARPSRGPSAPCSPG